ncbi:hypothetical protein [Bradyrhizobium sp. 166]|uniref:hypothetical protein n=1 Tax=Bradyrhizobium sp. 166 TaxID=2782638 RepID=UPI001FF8963A|nr:hypothetical protein [Bradyrhizobium sp. 166]
MAALRRGSRAPQPLAAPAGKTPISGSITALKIFLFIRISDYHIKSHPNPAEGRIAIVTNAGWDVVDVGHTGAKASQGGQP